MHSTIVTGLFPDWGVTPSSKVRFANWLLGKCGASVRLVPPTGVMTNIEQRVNMYHLLSQVLAYAVPGDVVELGCHEGRSAMLFRTIMDGFGSDKELHVYDSFAGLPELRSEDGETEFLKAGHLATTEGQVLAGFEARGLAPPIIHAGWFDATLSGGLPERIAFAHLDGDFYDSIMVSLQHVYPRLSPGAVCLIDDYADPEVFDGWNELPGVKRACDEYLADKPERVSLLYAGRYSHGYFRKQ